MPIAISCPQCARGLKVPDQAAGKTVKCPACQRAIQVPAAQSTPVQPAVARTQRPVAPSKPAAAPKPVAAVAPQPTGFDFSAPPAFDDDLFSEKDFDVAHVGSVPRGGLKQTDIPEGEGAVKPRPASFYELPGKLALGATILNLIVLLTLMTILIVGISRSDEDGKVFMIIMTVIWAAINIGFTVPAVFGSLSVMHRSDRPSGFKAAAELFVAPIFIGLGMGVRSEWVVGGIVGGCIAAYNWPMFIWLTMILSGDQAKIDFGDLTKDDLEDAAQELRRRASGLGGGH